MNQLIDRQFHLPFSDRLDYDALVSGTIDAISAWLTACALMSVLFDLLGYQFPASQLILPTLCALLCVFITVWQWWLLPSALLLLTGVSIFYAFYQDDLPLLLSYWSGFFEWAFAGMPNKVPYSENNSRFLVQMLLALPAAVLSYSFVRRYFSILVLAGLTGALTVIGFYQEFAGMEFMLCAMLAACAINLPRITLRSTKKEKIEGKKQHVSRASMQLLAIPAACLCLVLTVSLVPRGEEVWRSKFMGTIIGDVRDWYEYYHGGTPSTQVSYSVGQSGLMPLVERLGGDVDPSDNRLFSIRTDKAYFLRAAVYDTYDGKNWYDSGNNGRFRYSSLLWHIRRAQVFGQALPIGGASAQDLYDRMTTKLDYSINNMHKAIPNYLVIGQLKKITWMQDGPQVYFNSQGELFPEEYGEAYSRFEVDSVLLDRSLLGFDTNMMQLETITAQYRDEQYELSLEQYTQLPELMPDSVFVRAEKLTQGETSPYKKALAIEAWLRDSCTYTLTPGTPPADRDFVEHFLETKQGYCTYYASAMTVMARCVGLPARYVTGFGMRRDSGSYASDQYVVYNSTAHAWCEIYFSGIGWVIFDPLIWDDSPLVRPERENMQRKPDAVASDYEADYGEEEQEWEDPEQIGAQLAAISRQQSGQTINWNFLWYISGAASLAAVLWRLYLCVMETYFRRYRFTSVMQRFDADLCAAAEYYYSDLIRQLSFWNVRPQRGETLSRFGARVDKLNLDENLPMQRVCALMSRMRYGEIAPSQEEIRMLYYAHDALESSLMKILGRWRYLIERILLRSAR